MFVTGLHMTYVVLCIDSVCTASCNVNISPLLHAGFVAFALVKTGRAVCPSTLCDICDKILTRMYDKFW